MSDSEQEDLEGFATLVMVVALSISLSACVLSIVHAIWPYLLTALEAWKFVP